MSRWGMPYEPKGIRAIVACMDRHALQPIGNAFDFCYLDTTSYRRVSPRGLLLHPNPRRPRDVTKGQSVCHIPYLRNLQILQVSKVTSYKLAKNASL